MPLVLRCLWTQCGLTSHYNRQSRPEDRPGNWGLLIGEQSLFMGGGLQNRGGDRKSASIFSKMPDAKCQIWERVCHGKLRKSHGQIMGAWTFLSWGGGGNGGGGLQRKHNQTPSFPILGVGGLGGDCKENTTRPRIFPFCISSPSR